MLSFLKIAILAAAPLAGPANVSTCAPGACGSCDCPPGCCPACCVSGSCCADGCRDGGPGCCPCCGSAAVAPAIKAPAPTVIPDWAR